MATPTLTPDLTTISACDSTSGWSGPTLALEPDLKIQGTNSISAIVRNNGTTIEFTGTIPNGGDMSGQHIRFWVNTSVYSIMQTQANGGLRFYMTNGGQTAYWNVAGIDTYFGGWLNIVVYADSTPDSGTVTTTGIDGMGIEFGLTASYKRVINTYVDYLRYGDGLIATGGTSGDPITLAEIAAVDIANGYGIISNIDGVIFSTGELQIGNGATATDFDDEGDVLIYKDLNVESSLYKLIFTGSGCDVEINGGYYAASSGQTFTFDADDTGLGSFVMNGKQIVRADNSLFAGSGKEIKTCVFDACGQIDPGLTQFENNTIGNSTDVNGALYVPQVNNITLIQFINNTYSAYVDQIGPYTFDAMTFDGLGTADVYNAYGSGVTINLTGGSNPTTYAGSIVTFVASYTHELTDMVLNTEVTYVLTSNGSEVFHVENVGATGKTTYTHGGGESVDILIHHIDYQPDISNIYGITLPNADASLKIQQFDDLNYENPP